MSPRMKILFTISLLLNIAMAGIGAGWFFNAVRDVPIPASMSPEARHFIARTFQEGRDEIKPVMQDMKERRAAVEAVLTAETFDKDAYDEAVGKLLDMRDSMNRKKADIMGRALAELPPEDRKTFSKNIISGIEGRKPHKGGYHKKHMKEEDGR